MKGNRMNTKISVIIPAYNTEAYIRQCVESVLHQTLEGVEVIVVDDGSSDGTLGILKEYEKCYPEKICVLHKENGGQASARNLALRHAKGEYLGFVDSDDWVELEMYDAMYKKAKEEDADIVICDTTDHYPTYDVYHHASIFDDKFSVTPSACNKIFKASFAKGIQFPEGLWYEDFEYTTKLLMMTEKISVIHKSFYHCHCREVSTMSNNNSEKNKNILTVLGNLEKFVEAHGWKEKYERVMEYLYIEHILITTINRLENQKSKEKSGIIRYLRKEVLKKYPHFYKDEAFCRFPRNRKVIACLNAVGLSKLSKFIFYLKSKL